MTSSGSGMKLWRKASPFRRKIIWTGKAARTSLHRRPIPPRRRSTAGSLDYTSCIPTMSGRCGHICNASYAVSSEARGLGIGEKLVRDCLIKGKEFGFRILQFNAVVENNLRARRLYERLGFTPLGVIPAGFRMKDGHYENICPYYFVL